jgi:hypothetical protein
MPSLQQLIRTVKAVQAVDAVKRKPEEYRRQSFFGEYDLWLYVAVYDDRLCNLCWAYAKQQVFRGSSLRSLFPYLTIEDNDMIRVHVHPHCRCQLLRILDFKLYEEMMLKLEERENE